MGRDLDRRTTGAMWGVEIREGDRMFDPSTRSIKTVFLFEYDLERGHLDVTFDDDSCQRYRAMQIESHFLGRAEDYLDPDDLTQRALEVVIWEALDRRLSEVNPSPDQQRMVRELQRTLLSIQHSLKSEGKRLASPDLMEMLARSWGG